MEGVDLTFLDGKTWFETSTTKLAPATTTTTKSSIPSLVEILQCNYSPISAASPISKLSSSENPTDKWAQIKTTVNTSTLLNVAPKDGAPDVERVSTGTKYALALWLRTVEVK